MKKILKIFLPILLIGLFAFMSYKVISKINHKKEVAENIKTIPKFEYQNLEGNSFTNDNLKDNTSKLFIYYNSECDFCKEEAKMINENMERFKATQIIFISFEELSKIKEFATNHQLDTYDNVTFLCDSKISFATTFDVKSMPCLVLYDKENNLIEKIKGQVKIETVLEKFHN